MRRTGLGPWVPPKSSHGGHGRGMAKSRWVDMLLGFVTCSMWLWLSKPFWDAILFWLVGEFTTQFRLCFGEDWDVHWVYGLLTHGHVLVVMLVCFLSTAREANPHAFFKVGAIWLRLRATRTSLTL